jgi:hypothetical protein
MHHKWCFTLLGVFLFGTVLFLSTGSAHVLATSVATHIRYHSNLPPPNVGNGPIRRYYPQPSAPAPVVPTQGPSFGFGPVAPAPPLNISEYWAGQEAADAYCRGVGPDPFYPVYVPHSYWYNQEFLKEYDKIASQKYCPDPYHLR